jgi:hypothetical protein
MTKSEDVINRLMHVSGFNKSEIALMADEGLHDVSWIIPNGTKVLVMEVELLFYPIDEVHIEKLMLSANVSDAILISGMNVHIFTIRLGEILEVSEYPTSEQKQIKANKAEHFRDLLMIASNHFPISMSAQEQTKILSEAMMISIYLKRTPEYRNKSFRSIIKENSVEKLLKQASLHCLGHHESTKYPEKLIEKILNFDTAEVEEPSNDFAGMWLRWIKYNNELYPTPTKQTASILLAGMRFEDTEEIGLAVDNPKNLYLSWTELGLMLEPIVRPNFVMAVGMLLAGKSPKIGSDESEPKKYSQILAIPLNTLCQNNESEKETTAITAIYGYLTRLKPSGRLVGMVPKSDLFSKELRDLRNAIKNEFAIRAIIKLEKPFETSATDVCMIIIENKEPSDLMISKDICNIKDCENVQDELVSYLGDGIHSNPNFTVVKQSELGDYWEPKAIVSAPKAGIRYVRLDSVCDIIPGINLPNDMLFPDRTETGIPYLRIQNFDHGILSIKKARRTPGRNAHIVTQKNDVLMAAYWTPDRSFCKTAFVENEDKYTISSQLAILRPNTDKIDPLYLSVILMTRSVTEDIGSRMSGAYISRIPQRNLRKLQIPLLPTLEEQREAVKTIGELRRRYLREINRSE